MHFTLIRYILGTFLVTAVGFMLACLVALSSLEQVAAQLQTADAIATLDLIRNRQLIVLVLSLTGLLGGLIGVAFAVKGRSPTTAITFSGEAITANRPARIRIVVEAKKVALLTALFTICRSTIRFSRSSIRIIQSTRR